MLNVFACSAICLSFIYVLSLRDCPCFWATGQCSRSQKPVEAQSTGLVYMWLCQRKSCTECGIVYGEMGGVDTLSRFMQTTEVLDISDINLKSVPSRIESCMTLYCIIMKRGREIICELLCWCLLLSLFKNILLLYSRVLISLPLEVKRLDV